MKREVKWDIDIQISENLVREHENSWRISFPDEYVHAVTHHDGAKLKVKNDYGEWKEGMVHIPKWHGQSSVVALLKYSHAISIASTQVVITYNAFKKCLPEPNKIFPFAIDGSGNVFFFDYRKIVDAPTVAFLDHERAVTEEDLADEDLDNKPLGEWLNNNLYPVCNSFSELLDLIQPIED